jgi:hypothetical protein
MPTITFKVGARDAARIRALAKRDGISVSEFLRRRATQAVGGAPRAGDYHIAMSDRTGLPVMHAPPGNPTVSSEQIRALLAEFP